MRHAEQVRRLVIELQRLEWGSIRVCLTTQKALGFSHDRPGKGPREGMPKQPPDRVRVPVQQRHTKSVEKGEHAKLRFCCN